MAEYIFRAELRIKRRRHFLFAGLPVLFPLLAGQGGEEEGGNGGKAADDWRWRWSWEASSMSITSAAFWPADIHAGEFFGVSSTSFVRPFLRLATALSVGMVASGFVPAAVHDGGSAGLRLNGGEREGPNCFEEFFSRVFSTITRDLRVICILMGSFVKACMSTAVI
jgi:hypothetical protein